MLELKRIGCEVYCNDKKLTIVKQESKGPGKEVVKIDGLTGSNGKKWLSLKLLQEGLNVIDDEQLKGRVLSKGYQLNDDEQSKIDELNQKIDDIQSQIDEIINQAKERYKLKNPTKVKKVKEKPIEELNKEELKAFIEKCKLILATKMDKE